MLYASIIIDISHENVDRMFQYRIPDSLQDKIGIGTLVSVPFGNGNRTRKGYVVELSAKADYEEDKMKEIAGIVPGSVTADTRLIMLAWWMKERYGSTMNQALKTVLPVKRKVKARKDDVLPTGSLPAAGGTVLNTDQQRVVEAFRCAYDAGDRTPFLLYGVTGSGKTEVYMAMIEHVLAAGRQVIVLIPEISLTWQTVLRFYRRFGERICVMHSRLSAGERYEQFDRARNGKTDIMIGARSALFTPFSNLGLIVMDEEHEGAYKSEMTPRYHAREVAEKLSRMHNAAFVMGSATPSVESYDRARSGIYRLFELPNRASKEMRPASVEVVDLRKEIQNGNKSIFSDRLRELMADRMEKKEQTMLFINRRGYSSFVSCRACGEALKCPHCDVSLTLHNRESQYGLGRKEPTGRQGRMVCHYCGFQMELPKRCPSCGSPYLAGFGIGTQKIETLTRELFPEARILRMDMDTTSKKGSHDRLLSSFANGEADILIGTQMIVKGHDFPGVTLVGILVADLSLCAPDFRSAERTFQLLVQAAGRAGRGNRAGTAVIQSYMPEHYSIRTAADQNYPAFFEKEMDYRSVVGYPPVCHMLCIQVAGKEEELVTHMMESIRVAVEHNFGTGVPVIGPVPAPVYKINDIYRKNLYMKQKNYDILIRIQKYVQNRWDETESCRRLTVQYDFS